MSPIAWAVRPFQRYADFSGRAARPEFWWFFLIYIIVWAAAKLADTLLQTHGIGRFGVLDIICSLLLFLPLLGVTVRRLHDVGRAGWWFLIAFVPQFITGWRIGRGAASGVDSIGGTTGLILSGVSIVGELTLLVLLVLPGRQGANRYGPDPYGPSQLEEVFA